MDWNTHSYIENKHAFLGASKYSWVNYDIDRLDLAYEREMAKQRGTRLHFLASELIELGLKMPRSNKSLNKYVNDAIGYKMKPEQPLFYSRNCFGTADAISFRKDVLRIHDYKSGFTPAKMVQLEIYAALFCLEYKVNPNDIQIILCIYQNNEIKSEEPDPTRILYIMAKIKEFDARIEHHRKGA